jgi:hypothetical protein
MKRGTKAAVNAGLKATETIANGAEKVVAVIRQSNTKNDNNNNNNQQNKQTFFEQHRSSREGQQQTPTVIQAPTVENVKSEPKHGTTSLSKREISKQIMSFEGAHRSLLSDEEKLILQEQYEKRWPQEKRKALDSKLTEEGYLWIRKLFTNYDSKKYAYDAVKGMEYLYQSGREVWSQFYSNTIGLFGNETVLSTNPTGRVLPDLCLCGGIATLAIAISLVKENKVNNLAVISHPSWIENIHTDWRKEPWGQSKRYLPGQMLIIMNELHPHHPDNEPMTFGQMMDILKEVRRQLKNAGVRMIEYKVDSIYETSENYLAVRIKGKEQIVFAHNNYNIVTNAREAIGVEKITLRNFGEAYSQSKESLQDKPMVVIGSGQNAVWCARDFGKIAKVIHVIPKNDRSLEGDFAAVFQLKKAIFKAQNDGTVNIIGTDAKTGKQMTFRTDKNNIYSAMGYEEVNLIENADPKKVRVAKTAPNKDADTYIAINATGHASRKTRNFMGTMLPNGNMLTNYFIMLTELRKLGYDTADMTLSSFKTVCFMDGFKDVVLEKAAKSGIKISDVFFQELFHAMKQAFTHYVPNENQLETVMKKVYDKVGRMPQGPGLLAVLESSAAVYEKNGKPLDFEQFKEVFFPIARQSLHLANVADVTEKENDNATVLGKSGQ